MDIEFGQWMPDLPDLNNPGCLIAKNVVPQLTGFTEIRDISAFSGALADVCLGTYWMKEADETIHNFAGDASDLYTLDTATWDEVSKTTGGYSVENWDFTKFGDRVIATAANTPPQYYDVGTSTTFDDLPGSPPQAARIGVVRDFIVMGDLSTGSNKLQWSGFNNSEQWTPSRATQSDTSTLFGNSGRIQRIVPGEYGVIFQEHSIRRMDYVGPPTIFQINEVDRNLGTPAPNSVCWTGTTIYYYGHDGFYVFDGARSTAIGSNRVNRWFQRTADVTSIPTMRGAIDRRNRLVMWAFSSTSSATNNMLIMYNWHADKWSYAEIDTEVIAEYVSPGYSLDELTTVLGLADIDSDSFLVDSDKYQGGALNIQAFNTSHAAGTLSGDALAACIVTKEITGPDHRLLDTDSIRPIVNGSASVVTTQIGHRKTSRDDVALTTAKGLNNNGESNRRKSSRYQRYQVNITGGFDYAQGVSVSTQDGGSS